MEIQSRCSARWTRWRRAPRARLEYGAHAARLVRPELYDSRHGAAEYERLYRSVVGRPPRAGFDGSMAANGMILRSAGSSRRRRVSSRVGRRRAPDTRVASTASWNRMGARSGHLPLDEHESAWGDGSSARLSACRSSAGPPDSISPAVSSSAAFFQQDEADLVHAVNWFASGYWSCWRSLDGRAIISSIRNSHLPAGLVHRTILPPLIRRAAGVLVNSERGRQLVVGTCKVPPARVAVVPNGIDVDLWRNSGTPGAISPRVEHPCSRTAGRLCRTERASQEHSPSSRRRPQAIARTPGSPSGANG